MTPAELPRRRIVILSVGRNCYSNGRGSWLAQRGCVVLTGWSFIRNYRDATNFSNGVNHKVYERFGHWLPIAKMVHDVQREAEFLRSLPEVDGDRLQY